MKKLLVLAIATAVFVLAGCYVAPIKPPVGYIYSDISAPVTTNGLERVGATKVGTAESMSILGLVSRGDCSIAAAARNGGITRVQHVDYHFSNIVGVIQRLTIKVYGE
jgi:hypothetical protein